MEAWGLRLRAWSLELKMSDEPSAPSDPERIPLSQAQPVRPSAARKPAPPSAAPSKVKAYLVIGIIVTSVLLIAAIGWRVYVKLTTKVVPPRNVAQEWENAWAKSKKAWEELFKIQAGIWVEEKQLTPDDLAKFKSALTTYQQTSDAFHELNALMQKTGKGNSKEFQDIGERLVVLKTWIWDASGVLDPASKPPKYGGLYIPMYTGEKRMGQASKRLLEIREQADQIIGRADAAEIEKTTKEVKSLEDKLAVIRDELRQLDDDLLAGLTLPDLKKEQLRELEDLRNFQNIAQMSFIEARKLRSRFPSAEELQAPKEPPKEPPKEEPKKEEPKKEEPPKEEPPKKDPPKEEPPKEEPPK